MSAKQNILAKLRNSLTGTTPVAIDEVVPARWRGGQER